MYIVLMDIDKKCILSIKIMILHEKYFFYYDTDTSHNICGEHVGLIE